MTRIWTRWPLSVACLLAFTPAPVMAQTTAPSQDSASELTYVVYLSRHGVRSPTGLAAQYNLYSRAPWPTWDVPPGYLTPHGFHLMELFGEYDRTELARQGLLSPAGCGDADRVTFYADTDERTIETGKALAEGLLPGCHASVQSLPEGTNDPLFHFHLEQAKMDGRVPTQAVAEIAARIGSPAHLTEMYRPQLEQLDNILATCGPAAAGTQRRISLFDVPATLEPGSSDHLAELRSPLNTASTLVENLLLEYTEGMEASSVGWGCVDGAKIRSLIDLHTAATDLTERTPVIAQTAASNLLAHIQDSMEQAVTQKPVPGAVGKAGDRVLFLIGHDTNITNVAGLLNLNWVADGRRNDTPPGGALVFELWRNRRTGEFFVKTYFTVQTLEEMRSSAIITQSSPVERVPVFLPGCSTAGVSCTWHAFAQTIQKAVDARYVTAK